MEVFPAKVSTHIDAIDHSDEGVLAVASSSLSGRYWNGSFWIFQDASLAPNALSCSSSSPTEAGTTDLLWIDDKRLILASDTGAIDLWFLGDSTMVLENMASFLEHDNVVSSVSISCDKTKIVSGSWDNSVKIWDLHKETCISTFYGHMDEVLNVSCHPTEPELFLSCSKDRCMVLWDRRKEKPARTLLDHRIRGSMPTCATWSKDNTDTLAVGFEDGSVQLKTTGNKDSILTKYYPHKRTINRLLFSPKCGNWLASASDDCVVSVQDIGNNKNIFTSKSHTDFVRGLSWDPVDNTLRSSGWDMLIKSHHIDASAVTCDVNVKKEKIAEMDIDQNNVQSKES